MGKRFPEIPLAPFLRALRTSGNPPLKFIPKERNTEEYVYARAHMADQISVVVSEMMENRAARGPYGLLRGGGVLRNRVEVVDRLPYLEQFYSDDSVPQDYEAVLPVVARYFQDTFHYELNKHEFPISGTYIQGFFVEMSLAATMIQTGLQNYALEYGARPTFAELYSIIGASHDTMMFLSMMPRDQAFELISSLRDGRGSGPWNPDLVPLSRETGGLQIIADWESLPNYRTIEKSNNPFWFARLNPPETIADIPVTVPNTGCPAHQDRSLVNIWEWFMEVAIPQRTRPPQQETISPEKWAIYNHIMRSTHGRMPV